MCVSISATVALGCLFVPKLHIVLFQPHKNVRAGAKPGSGSGRPLFGQKSSRFTSLGAMNGDVTSPSNHYQSRHPTCFLSSSTQHACNHRNNSLCDTSCTTFTNVSSTVNTNTSFTLDTASVSPSLSSRVSHLTATPTPTTATAPGSTVIGGTQTQTQDCADAVASGDGDENSRLCSSGAKTAGDTIGCDSNSNSNGLQDPFGEDCCFCDKEDCMDCQFFKTSPANVDLDSLLAEVDDLGGWQSSLITKSNSCDYAQIKTSS